MTAATPAAATKTATRLFTAAAPAGPHMANGSGTRSAERKKKVSNRWYDPRSTRPYIIKYRSMLIPVRMWPDRSTAALGPNGRYSPATRFYTNSLDRRAISWRAQRSTKSKILLTWPATIHFTNLKYIARSRRNNRCRSGDDASKSFGPRRRHGDRDVFIFMILLLLVHIIIIFTCSTYTVLVLQQYNHDDLKVQLFSRRV